MAIVNSSKYWHQSNGPFLPSDLVENGIWKVLIFVRVTALLNMFVIVSGNVNVSRDAYDVKADVLTTKGVPVTII